MGQKIKNTSSKKKLEKTSKILSSRDRPLRKRHRALFCIMTEYVKKNDTIIVSENLSMGGAFLEMAEPLAPGTKVKLRFPLESVYNPVHIEGLVTWNRKERARGQLGNKSTGVGIRFQKIKKTDRDVIKDLLDHTHNNGWFL